MPNYLNQIESDLYKLYSITNGSGEVVEMVAELREKYEKAEAFDRIAKMYNFFKAEHRSTIPTDDETLDFAIDISEITEEYESGESE